MNLFRRLFNPEKEAEAEAAAKTPVAPPPAPIVIKVDEPAPAAPAETAAPAEAPTPAVAESVTAELNPNYVADGATRPLSEDVLIAFMGNGHLTFGLASDVGLVRNNNQDSAYSFFSANRSVEERPDFGLFVVADGMGGHLDGEKASALAARTVAAQVFSTIFSPLMAGDSDNQAPITETLSTAIEKANGEVLRQVPDGGTTVTSTVIIGDLAYIAHVGDSRLYLITKDSIEQLTRDHSLVQRLIELDQLTPAEAADHPNKNMLYRALGQSETIEVDTLTRRLPPKSHLLLCSDGLWNLVEDREIVDIVRQTPNPQEACNKLIALANTRGGGDNITVLLLHMPG